MRGSKLHHKICEQAANIRWRIAGVTRPVKMLDNTQTAGLVKVTLGFVDHAPDSLTGWYEMEHIIAEGEVAKFVAASLELHYEPGRGPHAGPVSPVQYITTQPLRASGPYWWSVPGLSRNGDPAGAVIWVWGSTTCVWGRPEVMMIDEDDPSTSAGAAAG